MDEFIPQINTPLVLVLVSTFIGVAFAVGGSLLATSQDRARLTTFLYPVACLVLAGLVAYFLAAWWQGVRTPLVGAATAIPLVVLCGAFAGWILARWTKWFPKLISMLSTRFANHRQLVWIVCSFALALIATWPLARFAFTAIDVAHVASTTKDFWSNFYINWTASLLFWAIVGFVGTVVALARPEDLPFAERVRILFGGSHSKSAADMETLVRQIGQINEKICRRFCFLQWDDERKAVQLQVETTICIKNLLKDVESVLVGDVIIEFDQLTPAPVDDKYGEFQRYRIGPTAHVKEDSVQVMKWPKFVYEHQSIRINPAGTEEIEMKMVWWAAIGGNQQFSFVSPRFTECMDVKFERGTSYQGPDIIITHATDSSADLKRGSAVLTLNSGNRTASLPLRNDILARERCYEFTLAPSK